MVSSGGARVRATNPALADWAFDSVVREFFDMRITKLTDPRREREEAIPRRAAGSD